MFLNLFENTIIDDIKKISHVNKIMNFNNNTATEKKYKIDTELTREINDVIVYRIIANKNIYDDTGNLLVEKGQKGGWVSNSNNLSQTGCCWIDEDGIVIGENSLIKDSAWIGNNVLIYNSIVKDSVNLITEINFDDFDINTIVSIEVVDSIIQGLVEVFTENGKIEISNSVVKDEAVLKDNVKIYNSNIEDFSLIENNSVVKKSKIRGNTHLSCDSEIYELELLDDEYDDIVIEEE